MANEKTATISATSATAPVAPRADFKREPVFVKASIADQAGSRPGFVRKWFSTDPKHPSYWGKFVSAHRVGDPVIGYCPADRWSVVSRHEAKDGRKRDDDTSGIEGALTHGDLVCLETTEDNAQVYDHYDKLKDHARTKALRGGDDEVIKADNGGTAHYRAAVVDGRDFAGDPRDPQARAAILNR